MYKDISDEDLMQLFDNCVLRYNKIPVVVRAYGRGTLIANSLAGEEFKNKMIGLSDKGLDFTPVPLGFCNNDLNTYYISRRPLRQYVVGLNSRNMNFSVPENGNPPNDRGLREIQALRSKGLRECIMGIYPSVGEALEKVEKNKGACIGIDRSFAVDFEHRLFFKEKCVGIIEKDGKPTFFHSKNYMKVLWERGYAK